ncbi:hypothetical protein O181_121791 [Austropuccinia psidii MF-1]|uniref:Uncharacterized protein n=1 Tax=Austropuccinia psidii MF-1 TaxID=1389203 RepID=A0A9Q3KKA1_9BASI|nr:hypothetical protein [Austropuccinia psidii MF-1]
MNSRYLSRPSTTIVNKSSDIDVLFQMQDDFKQAMRTSKDGFIYIHNKMKDHKSFQNHSNSKQLPISHQLALILEQLGSNGNSGLVGKVAQNFHVDQDTVVLITRKVIKAINSFKEEYIEWPNSCRRFEMLQVIQKEGFDGTTFSLCQKPAWQREIYFDCKKVYSINAQVL